jgi:Co/Zn/Cd efflux system component
MGDTNGSTATLGHSHVFLGEGHEKSERKTWAVIWLCGAMMIAEIVGGLLFGSIALVADGLHMSTHAGALLLAALAYTYARKHAEDPRFSFGTGKLGDLAGFTSAIILAMIALLIGYESVTRIFAPVPIHFTEAIPIACLGLAVNIASAWLLSGGGGHRHDHSHGHGHGHGHEQGAQNDHDESKDIATTSGALRLEVFEDGVPPRFRLRAQSGTARTAQAVSVETIRPDGTRQVFVMRDQGDFLESVTEIPEPHAFTANVRIGQDTYPVTFQEHDHAEGSAGRDNNIRAAVTPRRRRCRRVRLCHRWATARPRVRLALDGSARWHHRGLCHRELVLRVDPRHWRYSARYEPGSDHGGQAPPSRRRRGGSARRFTPMAIGAWTPRSDCLRGYGATPRGELL